MNMGTIIRAIFYTLLPRSTKNRLIVLGILLVGFFMYSVYNSPKSSAYTNVAPVCTTNLPTVTQLSTMVNATIGGGSYATPGTSESVIVWRDQNNNHYVLHSQNSMMDVSIDTDAFRTSGSSNYYHTFDGSYTQSASWSDGNNTANSLPDPRCILVIHNTTNGGASNYESIPTFGSYTGIAPSCSGATPFGTHPSCFAPCQYNEGIASNSVDCTAPPPPPVDRDEQFAKYVGIGSAGLLGLWIVSLFRYKGTH